MWYYMLQLCIVLDLLSLYLLAVEMYCISSGVMVCFQIALVSLFILL